MLKYYFGKTEGTRVKVTVTLNVHQNLYRYDMQVSTVYCGLTDKNQLYC